VLPLKKQFDKQSEYYSTLFHEAVHSTGHESRLDRLTKTASFGSNEYSKEELVAEIGASTLVNMFGLETSSSFRNNTAYIQSWANALKNDINMIVHASSRAGKAVDMILDNK
jgi:antirestriction protein ArdC